MNIPGRYLVFGVKADLHALRKKELAEIAEVVFNMDDEESTCLRCALEEYFLKLEGMADIIAEAIDYLNTLGGE